MFILRIGSAAVCCASFLWTTDCWCQETTTSIKQTQGEFDSAVIWQKKASEIAPEFVRPELQKRLELFKAREPYRFALD